MEQIIIRNTQSPGDYIVLTAAIRDIKRAYPDRYEFGIDVPEKAVFLGNPNVNMGLRGGRKIVAKYPLIKQSNQAHLHFLWGFLKYLNEQLRVNVPLTELRPDLHLTEEEKANPPLGALRPYWVMVSGGKRDFTAKWWHPNHWQRVVDVLNKRFEIVQVGGGSHIHPVLTGVRNLVGKTSFRELMRLIYHSEGVMCIVTCLMHIAAAFNKPCVVVAGGREPWWWEGYTQENRIINLRHGIPGWNPPADDNYVSHQYLHTLDQLPCCMHKGCWKTKIEDRGDKCVMPVVEEGRRIPCCMWMINPDHVIQAVDSYYKRGAGPVRVLAVPKTETPAVLSVPQLVPTQPAPVPPAPAVPDAPSIRLCAFVPEVSNAFDYMKQLKSRFPGDLLFCCENSDAIRESWCLAEKASLVRAASPTEAQAYALHTNKQKWTVWLSYPWLPKSADTWSQLVQRGNGRRCAMGLVYWRRLKQEHIDWFRRAPWDKKVDFATVTLERGVPRTYYPGGGIWMIPTDFLTEIKFDSWVKNGVETDISLGEALHQHAMPLHEVGTLFLRA